MHTHLKLSLLFVVSIITLGNAQNISSKLIDSATQKPIPFATLQWNKKSSITNEEGRFSIFMDKNNKTTDTLIISCMGYKSIAKPLLFFTDSVVTMAPNTIALKEVLVSNKNYTAEEIIDLVKDSLEKNYSSQITQKRLFFRKSSTSHMLKTDYEIKESTIKELNKNLFDSIINLMPKSNSYYTEVLGDLYGNYSKDQQKLNLLKASELYDKSSNMDVDKLDDKLNDIIKKNVKTDSYFKVKSGLFGTKLDAEELFEEEVDSTDTEALNKVLEEKKNDEELRKKNFTFYRRQVLAKIFEELPITKGAKLNVIYKANKYQFTLKEYTYLGNDAVYVLDFKPKNSANYKGTVYINADDFALIRIDYENVNTVKNFKLLGISMNTYLSKGKIIFNKDESDNYTLRYYESESATRIGVKRPIKIIEKNKHVKGRNKQNELSGKVDFAFSDIEKNEIVVFDSKLFSDADFETLEESNNVLPTYMPNYDPEFWEGYTIIEPNKAIKEFKSVVE